MGFSLKGRYAIVTGANRGLGFEIAKAYVMSGAGVLLCARDGEELEAAALRIGDLTESRDLVSWESGDVSDPEDVKRIVDSALKHFPTLDILVNNAGVYGPKGEIERVDWEDWIKAIQINLFGSVMMVRAVLPHFKKLGHGKIVQLSGGGATNPIPRVSAYATSKAAIVRFSETLAEECRGFGIDVNSIAPGALNTRLLDEILEAGPEKVGKEFYERALHQKESGGASLERAASLAVFLGSSESDGITGKLISAVWDRWEVWPEHRNELSKSDLYTLRRITGRDRGLSWGDR